jgi:acetylornithine deacetylase/succinyl-diaminopimelate desuccinylase-like protein
MVRPMNDLTLNEQRFLDLLGRLVGHTRSLQNAPGAGLVPEERLAADVVLSVLKPHVDSGFLTLEAVAAPGHEKRPSLVITVQGSDPSAGSIGFVGAHFDVVPADEKGEGWTRDPFKLHVDPDGTLYGRGVTDCLGHVAVITDLLAQLAERKARPRRTLKVVFIANEEDSPIPEIGLDYVVSQKKMDDLRGHPVYWLDSADFGPTVGTGGMVGWELEVNGVTGHSGMPQNCVNALELGMALTMVITEWFRKTFGPHENEQKWGFMSSSSMKATIIHAPNNKITKIPGQVKIEGDIRLTPFYEMSAVMSAVQDFVKQLNDAISTGNVPLEGLPRTVTQSGQRGSVSLRFKGRPLDGVACKLDSPALSALTDAIRKVRGPDAAKPSSLTGSLPLVRDLQRAGCDVQITGFGRTAWYHAPNEQAHLGEFKQGFQVLRELLVRL